MKKNIYLLWLTVLIGTTAFAQTEFEAAKFGQYDLAGSARYMSMGGAYGALGGDASALKDNPAGLGVFRSSELSTTINLGLLKSSSDFNNVKSSADEFKFNFNNFAYVWSTPILNKDRGLLNSNFSFTYNKVKNFNRVTSVTGAASDLSFTDLMADITNGVNYNLMSYNNYDNPYKNSFDWVSMLGYQAWLIDTVPGTTDRYRSNFAIGSLITPDNYISETGGINEFGLTWGGNINNNFFIGAGLNLVTLDYQLTSQLSEKGGNNKSFNLISYMSQSGVGVNGKIGMIYLPTNSLRLGLALHTPTAYTVAETHNAVIYSSNLKDPEKTPLAEDSYRYRGPWQGQVSLAYLFGKSGLISAEYNYIQQSGAKYKNDDGTSIGFESTNLNINNELKNSNVIKLGGEYKLNDNVALRAGYSLATAVNPESKDGRAIMFAKYGNTQTNSTYMLNKGTQFFSIGAGYREVDWFLDFAYVLKMDKNDFYRFDHNFYLDYTLAGTPVVNSTNNLVVTVGLKF